MRRAALLASAMAAFAIGPAAASEAAGGCQLPVIGTGTVARVLDHRTLQLEDGRIIVLDGLAAGESAAPEAVATLARLTLAQSVVLKGHTSAADRYGRLAAQVVVGSERLERSVQNDMIANGFARVAARVGDAGCASALHRLEEQARVARRGIWADPAAVQRADNPRAILARRGQFALVEGTVLSVRESGATLYVNFGRRWSEDFTVTVARRDVGMFRSAGLEPKRLERRRVRVRGVIEERGGPWIEASRPEQIEILPGN